ncbi:hypothetical protein BKH46_07475 [Helicobacter sp. 12S02634-8]|uniref:hypothetical protein n=1 Tax=Helicobacter sp. 12S02634-8 TaxID=1476199 RepID=UPI000BA5F494|nr:hypothetical protein [Helicobacter sp. 12S02634-8]PAF46421.1 hypothetical protein BKH46_07475 [Helicobacter sp. 12S02634-8]
MLPNELLNKDIGALLNTGRVFKKDDLSFKGSFRSNAQVIYEDSSVGYQTTLLILSHIAQNLKLRDIITDTHTQKQYTITQKKDESQALTRLLLQEVKGVNQGDKQGANQ